MHLHWLGYQGYRERHRPGFWDDWLARYPTAMEIPEGGGGLMGAVGCSPIVDLIRKSLHAVDWPEYDQIWIAAGTGTTLAGLVLAEAGAHPVVGALAVPCDHGVPENVGQIFAAAMRTNMRYRLVDASRRGFGRVDDELLGFMRTCEAQCGVPLEPIYTAKTLLALKQAVEANALEAGSRIVFVHTGGLQGRRGFDVY
ncbi:hypothetical protein GCM10009304_14520 [Pseudomonas matsuisoli]|uniref:1-aminocyclopropane-1-carboxylate deaminase n=2 Tax=Pseudomonas matsuisoli TaxID=1515666 RepID=A0A917PSE6_9PSED|nr:hypothetical protein GCM10009304_14520 [Pseudomonas matsuisoli]